MAAKHDAKKARANHWVMQQNLAKQKGGRPGFKFNEKKAPRPVKTPLSSAPGAPGDAAKADAGPAVDATSAAVAATDEPSS